METLKIDCNQTKMIAHRGLSGLERENTAASFIGAGNKSYYGIECDIHKTKDGKYVVIHDDDTLRVSGIKKIIKESTLSELKDIMLYDVESKTPKDYLRIPTLEEYLEICNKYEKIAVIEFKNEFSEDEIHEVIDIVNTKHYLNYSCFISFHLNTLLTLRHVSSYVNIQYLTSKFDDEVFEVIKHNHFDLNIHHQAVSQEIVNKLHLHNIKINVWTVNNPIIALMLISWGVDYITTDLLE